MKTSSNSRVVFDALTAVFNGVPVKAAAVAARVAKMVSFIVEPSM